MFVLGVAQVVLASPYLTVCRAASTIAAASGFGFVMVFFTALLSL
ncbi:hypothetical protein [Bradyrhizobium sp. NP1]|nr:hypothetical protein [Bradyrhizobium sp. NP1]WJR77316.1 hypothetical protein QOU61_32060 [Bradyrhizobium sp. NP1]